MSRRLCFAIAALSLCVAESVCCSAAEPTVLEFLRTRRDRRFENVPRQVLAFYYTWYGTPERHGKWVHWGRVDPERFDISMSTHYPAKGAYDSHDPAIIDWHIDLAKQHGVTGFIATWWGQRTFDDRAFEKLVQRANEKDFHVTIYWETAPGQGQAQIDRAADDLLYVLRRYAGEPSFLKVDGRPVVFVYGRVMQEMPLSSWPAVIQRVRESYGDFLLIADGYDAAYARLFDGVHTYNICSWVEGKTPEQLRELSRKSFADAVGLARRHQKISCLTVIPGYDDTKIRKPGINAQRLGGQTYQVLWEEALAADPDWVLITSWNEWHEGSEIEPSREDGDRYIRLTGDYAPRFLAKSPVSGATQTEASAASAERATRLRELYQGKTIGILPDFGGDVAFWLAETGVPIRELTWTEVVDPAVFNAADLPLVLFAGSEHYVRTANQEGDVLRALQRYLSEGGFLLVMPYMPYPFFIDETGKPNNAAAQVGVPIAGSSAPRSAGPSARNWETPPADVQLAFQVDAQQLPGLPASAPFPNTGDLRWRPATRTLVADEDRYVPLATLRDIQGRTYGDGIALVEHQTGPLKGGRTLYVWMRMPELLGPEATFEAVLTVARKAIEP